MRRAAEDGFRRGFRRMAVLLAGMAWLAAGCQPLLVADPPSPDAMARAAGYVGLNRLEVAERCDMFIHYGLNSTDIVIGSGERLFYFADAGEVRENEQLMTANSWRVNFKPRGTPDECRYSYDEVIFSADGRVSQVRRGEAFYRAGL